MSRTIQLTPRLRMVADLLPRDVVLVDVGTDHAYLPAVLLLEGKIRGPPPLTCDPAPLNRARATVEEFGLEGKVKFCLCDGLAEISPREAGRRSHRGDGGRNDWPPSWPLLPGHGTWGPYCPSAHVVYGGPEGVAGDPRLPD